MLLQSTQKDNRRGKRVADAMDDGRSSDRISLRGQRLTEQVETPMVTPLKVRTDKPEIGQMLLQSAQKDSRRGKRVAEEMDDGRGFDRVCLRGQRLTKQVKTPSVATMATVAR